MRRLAPLAAALLAACATAPPTVFEATYVHPGFADKHYTTIAVAPIGEDPALRQAFGQSLVQYLSVWTGRAALGSDVLPRSLYDPGGTGRIASDVDLSIIRQHFADAGFQCVLTVAYRPKETLAPGAAHPWSEKTLREYFAARYAEAHAPGGLPPEVLIEANLYDTATGRVAWSGHSVTVKAADTVTLAQSYAAAVVDELVRRGLIAKPTPGSVVTPAHP